MNLNANEFMKKIQLLMSQGQVEEAIDLLEDSIKSNPKFVERWMLLASIFRAVGRIDKSIEICKKASEIIPDNSIIWNNLGHLYIEKNLYEEAIDPIKKALSGKSISFLKFLGRAFKKCECVVFSWSSICVERGLYPRY